MRAHLLLQPELSHELLHLHKVLPVLRQALVVAASQHQDAFRRCGQAPIPLMRLQQLRKGTHCQAQVLAHMRA